ncbi:MAG TPA: ABC transporter ATP-binding protein/permease [Candidatus Blautia merdavium]|uniref:ABC transporter ATP-binding protein/permease n=1 Tax=Candidatus Blautia merdavium TaxID=2838494 RepID=A0A9D2PRI4_9FIRM|nr:ABC transporter ATP-binding protein/permease [Candidatus Blautia merdavium]
MLHTIQKLIGKSKKELYFPIFLMCIDSMGSMALYFVLYLTVLDLFFGTLTMNKIGIYTLVCLLGVIYRIIVYRKSYLLCFERAFNVTGQFRIKLADHFRKLSLGYFNQNSTGYLINTMTNDMGSFEGVLSHALSFLMKTVTLCGLILVGTFFINWKLALAECVVLLFAVPLLRWGNRLVEQLGTKKRTMTARMVSTVMEYIKGIKIFKAHNMTSTHFERLLESLEKVRKISVQIECQMAPPTAIYSILVNFLMPLVLLGGSYLLLGGQIPNESFIAFLIMSMAISGLLISFEHYYIMLKDLKLAADNLEKAMSHAPLPYQDDSFTLEQYDVAFQKVCFSYDNGEEVLHHISFTAPEGSVTALIGPSGSGKSTVANLIARFWDVSSGVITIGGRDIRELEPDRLLQSISAVFQENTLLSDTILNNIRVGKPDATMEEVIVAAKAACCHDFILKLPDGYNTVLAEGGASLSGGEKQRIAIARAILKNAPILLLDESTASLDADNEERINRALDHLMKGKTVFVIAHRLNTIQNADQIILLNNGNIEEIGTHLELLKKRGHYYSMIQEQEKAKAWIAKGE